MKCKTLKADVMLQAWRQHLERHNSGWALVRWHPIFWHRKLTRNFLHPSLMPLSFAWWAGFILVHLQNLWPSFSPWSTMFFLQEILRLQIWMVSMLDENSNDLTMGLRKILAYRLPWLIRMVGRNLLSGLNSLPKRSIKQKTTLLSSKFLVYTTVVYLKSSPQLFRMTMPKCSITCCLACIGSQLQPAPQSASTLKYTTLTCLSRNMQELCPEPGSTYEHAIAAIMIWSDSTGLGQFGSVSLWPIYAFFGNRLKYDRVKPTQFVAHHVAYIYAFSVSNFFLLCFVDD